MTDLSQMDQNSRYPQKDGVNVSDKKSEGQPMTDRQAEAQAALDAVREAFDGDDVPKKNIALRRAYDLIQKLMMRNVINAMDDSERAEALVRTIMRCPNCGRLSDPPINQCATCYEPMIPLDARLRALEGK